MKKLAVAAAAVNTTKLALNAQAPSPGDIVQFALNLEYTEAEFFSIATTGQNLQPFGKVGEFAKGR